MASRFEAEIYYPAEHRALLETYAEAMGWKVLAWGDTGVIFAGEGSNAEDLLRDLQGHIQFFLNEDSPAQPLSYQIKRVIFDSLTGLDEITEDGD